MAKAKKTDTGANLGFEAKLWQSAVKLRNNMDAAEYKHIVLGLIFLKYISDAFEEHRQKMETGTADPDSDWYVKGTNTTPIPQGNMGCARVGAAQGAAFPAKVDDLLRWLDAHGVVLCDDCRQAILAALESEPSGSLAGPG